MRSIGLGGVLLALIIHTAVAQLPNSTRVGPTNPSALAKLVLDRFVSGTVEEFAEVYPTEDGRHLIGQAVSKRQQRVAGIGRVIWSTQDRAVLLLSGAALFGNSGDETIASRAFSGFYEAIKADDVWKISRSLPLDANNRIQSQDLDVTIAPGKRIHVTDTMQITVGERLGFAVRLNHRAQILDVRLNGKTVEHEFGGGLLWVRSDRTNSARLKITYSIEVEHNPKGDNSGNFLAESGHVRNQYFWHPFFDFNSSADLANFTISVHVPSDYHVTTSIPQTESVQTGVRNIQGRTLKPAFALSLLYDKNWQVILQQIESFRFETFLTQDFKPPRSQLETVFRRTFDLLSAKFGPPQANYFAVAQGRARGGGGWLYRTNDLIVAGEIGGPTSSAGPRPRAYFGHEVSHGWTSPTGPATNFLTEGWATYAESLLLEDEFGPEIESNFWEYQRNNYFTGNFDGRDVIINDPGNGGVAYSKGAWILRMLRYEIGEDAFNKGLRDYMKTTPGRPAGLEEFTAAMTRAAGHDVAPFLKPWVTASVIPDISARIEGQRLILTQKGPVFELFLDVELTTAKGKLRKKIELRNKEQSLDISDLDPVTEVRIDPDHRWLVQRHRGEVVHLELRARDARSVQINGDFTSKPVAATLVDGVWKIDLSLTEGRYYWYWIIDGKVQESTDGTSIVNVQVVQPQREVNSAYPH